MWLELVAAGTTKVPQTIALLHQLFNSSFSNPFLMLPVENAEDTLTGYPRLETQEKRKIAELAFLFPVQFTAEIEIASCLLNSKINFI